MQICPKCLRPLRNANAWHYCAQTDIDSLFDNKGPELPYVFDKLLAAVAEWNDVAFSATKNCVVFTHKKAFLIVRPMQKVLDLKFYSEELMDSPLIYKASSYNTKVENTARLARPEEVSTQLLKLIWQSYQLA